MYKFIDRTKLFFYKENRLILLINLCNSNLNYLIIFEYNDFIVCVSSKNKIMN